MGGILKFFQRIFRRKKHSKLDSETLLIGNSKFYTGSALESRETGKFYRIFFFLQCGRINCEMICTCPC